MRKSFIAAAVAGIGIGCFGGYQANAMTSTSPVGVLAASEAIDMAAQVHCRPYKHWHRWERRRTYGCPGGPSFEIRRGHRVGIHEREYRRGHRVGIEERESRRSSIHSRTTIRGERTERSGTSGEVRGRTGKSGETTGSRSTGESMRSGKPTNKPGTSNEPSSGKQ